MEDTVPGAEVRDFAAALRDALDPPNPASLEGWDLHDRMLVDRAAHIAGALRSLIEDTGRPIHLAEVQTAIIRELAGQALPYEPAGGAK
jgi:hypothetical protein